MNDEKLITGEPMPKNGEYSKEKIMEWGIKIADLMEKYHIDYIGGCPCCQPDNAWGEGWGMIPDKIRELFTDKDSCCEAIDEYGRKVKNYPIFCKYEKKVKR